MGLKKILIFGGIAVVVIGGGIGGAVVYLHHGAPAAANKPVVVVPKPIYFAQLDNVVVSIPALSLIHIFPGNIGNCRLPAHQWRAIH